MLTIRNRSCLVFWVWCFGFGVLGLVFWVWCFGFGVLVFGVLGLVFGVLGLVFEYLCTKYQTQNTKHKNKLFRINGALFLNLFNRLFLLFLFLFPFALFSPHQFNEGERSGVSGTSSQFDNPGVSSGY